MNHERVNISTLPISCGVLGLDRISDETDDVLFAIASRLYHPSRGSPAAQVIWSDLNENSTAGQKLWAAVNATNKRFGWSWVSPPVENPKTGHIIVTYVWEINHEPFKQWYINERTKRMRVVAGIRLGT